MMNRPQESKPLPRNSSLSKKIFEAFKEKHKNTIGSEAQVNGFVAEEYTPQSNQIITRNGVSPMNGLHPTRPRPQHLNTQKPSASPDRKISPSLKNGFHDPSTATLSDAISILRSSLEVDMFSPSVSEEGCDVFLGGSCGDSTWRQDISIPLLSANGISFYNPQVDNWTPDMVQIEAQAKEKAKVLLFVVNNSTRALASISEVIEYICRGRNVILVIQDITDGASVGGDIVTGGELKDLNRARAYLRDCASRHGVRVYSDVRAGVQVILRILKQESVANQVITPEEGSGSSGDEAMAPLSPRRKLNISRRVSLRCAQRRSSEVPVTYQSFQRKHMRNYSIPGALPSMSTIEEESVKGQALRRRKSMSPRAGPWESVPSKKAKSPANVTVSWRITPQEIFSSLHSEDPIGVFLGGSCNPTTWRKEIAVPLLEESVISYYNPQVDVWTSDLIVKEAKAKEEATILLFVIDNTTRATVSMGEATEHICRGRNVVLVIQDIEDGSEIDGVPIHGNQLKDLNRVRAYLRDIAHRHGIVVHTDIQAATESAIKLYHFVTQDTDL